MATPAQGTGGLFSAGTQRGFNAQLKKVYTWYTGGFLIFIVALAILEQMGLPRAVDRLPVPARDDRPLRRHRRDEPDVRRGRVLRRRAARAGALQRHGDRRRLDVGGVVHRHGRHAVPARLQRPRVRHGLDRRLLPRRAAAGAVPAQVRAVHDSRLPRRALRRQHPALRRHPRRDPLLVHVRGGADLRCRPHHDAPDRRAVRARDLPGPGRHPGLLVPGRHARGHVDAGRAVHHPDRRVHDPGRVAVGEADRHPAAAVRLRQAAGEGDGPRGRPAQGPEGNPGPRHLQGARGRGGREAQGRPEVLRRGQGRRDRGGREGEGRERGAGSARRCREDAGRIPGRRRGRQVGVDEGGGARGARGTANTPRGGLPRQGRRRARHLAGETSWRWCSA